MLNYVLSTAGSLMGKLFSSSQPSSQPCLVPGQNVTGAICPVGNASAIAADEEKCSIYYPSTADIAECMQYCYNCCSNATQAAIKEAIKLYQATYYQCGGPTPPPPTPGEKTAAPLDLTAMIPLLVTALISGVISVRYFYKTFADNGISPKNVTAFISSSLVSAGTLGAGMGVLASSVADDKTIGALSGVVTALGVLGLMQTGRANINRRAAQIAYDGAVNGGEQAAIDIAAPLMGPRAPVQVNCPDLRAVCCL